MTGASEELPAVARWAALGVIVIFTALGVARDWPDGPWLSLASGAIALSGGAAAITARRPVTFLASAAVSTVGIVVLGNGTSSNVCWFALCLLAGWSAVTSPKPIVIAFWSAATAVLVVEVLLTTPDPGWAAWIAGVSFTVVGCLFGRRQLDLVLQLREAQAGLANRARAEERNRIARELHDVIAHSLTVSLLHISAARLAVEDDPADAARALAEAELLTRASLEEVRHVVAPLRLEGSPDRRAPLPGSIDIPALIERFRDAAGVDVHASFSGTLESLPATVGLAAYRILQEALTNAAKHAPRSQVSVDVAVDDHAVQLVIHSAGTPGRGEGLGLLGIRERAESLGGTCEVGPGGSGWTVRTRIPLEARPVA
jgi:signal transduction histidine kinase